MLFVAVGWQVYAMTHRALDLGIIGLVQFIPMASFAIFSGQVADRVDRRRIMIVCQIAYALILATLAILANAERLTPIIIFSLLFLFGTTRTFWGPAMQSFLPRLVSRERLPQAVAWNGSAWQVAVIIGPTLGGLLYGWTGHASIVYGTAAFLLLLATVSILTVRARTGRSDPKKVSRKTAVAGIHFVWHQKILLGAMSLDLFAVLLGGVLALLPAFASDILKVGPSGLGLLRASPSIGASLTGLLISLRPLKRNVGPRFFICVALFGLFTILFGLSTSFFLSIGCLIAAGAVDFVSVVTRQSLFQLRTPDSMRGRVAAANLLFIGGSNELGDFRGGLVAAWLGLAPAVIIGGIGTWVVAALWTRLFPSLRKLDRFVDPDLV